MLILYFDNVIIMAHSSQIRYSVLSYTLTVVHEYLAEHEQHILTCKSDIPAQYIGMYISQIHYIDSAVACGQKRSH